MTENTLALVKGDASITAPETKKLDKWFFIGNVPLLASDANLGKQLQMDLIFRDPLTPMIIKDPETTSCLLQSTGITVMSLSEYKQATNKLNRNLDMTTGSRGYIR
jgi:hypothetical protein